MLKAALTWGIPRSPSWEHMSCSDPRLGWPGDPGEALRSIRSLWSSFPCWAMEGCALYSGLTLMFLKSCAASLVRWFALHPTAVQTATERDPGAPAGSADFTVLPGQGPAHSCLKPHLIS